MKKRLDAVPIQIKDVENKIITLRNQQVLIDRDVAELYGVETKRLGEAIRNNPEKFPEGYVFELQRVENQQLAENFDRFETIKHSISTKAFTERGLYMLVTILKSPRATQTTICIIEAYAKLKELTRSIDHLSHQQEASPSMLKRAENILSDLIDESRATEVESTFEVNLVALKYKKTIKRTTNNSKS